MGIGPSVILVKAFAELNKEFDDYFAGKSAREIAALLEISRDAVKKRLERARDALSRELLDEFSDSLEPERTSRKRTLAIMGALEGVKLAWSPAAVFACRRRCGISFSHHGGTLGV